LSGVNAYYTVWRSRRGEWAMELHGSVLVALALFTAFVTMIAFVK
jgi:hypothetical protein